MPVTSSDISFVLSGGTTNTDPNLSLGGDPSSTPITDDVLNNLFDDVSPKEGQDGSEDYRCFYVFNDGDSPIYNIDVWIESQIENGASVEIGIKDIDESQRITIESSSDLPSGGSLTLSYDGSPFVINHNGDHDQFAENIESALNSLIVDDIPVLRTTSVSAQVSSNGLILVIDVLFQDEEGRRNHELLEVTGNALTPFTQTISISTPQPGSPINTVASTIVNEFTPPGNVSFYQPTSQSPISFFKLLPTEGFPIWVKRVTPEGADSQASDGFSMKFKIETIDPVAS